MNYYERHLGDYARDAGHLSLLEEGVFCRLLDRYYVTERGIPEDQVMRVTRASTKAEREAVNVVLREFFSLTGGIWINNRAEEEIAKARARIEAAQRNGRHGGRPKKNPPGSDSKPTGFELGSEIETQQKAHHAPDTSLVTNTSQALTTTEAGRACRLMREAGCPNSNPSHPNLLAALDEGVTPEALADTTREAIDAGKAQPFAWAIATARSRRAEGASTTTGGTHGNHPSRARGESAVERVERANRKAGFPSR